jgi:hypothetical protein
MGGRVWYRGGMEKFRKFHWSLIKEAFQSLQRIRSAAVLIASLIIAIVLAIHPQAGGMLSGVYETKSLTWPLVPLVLGVTWTLVWANYKRHLSTEAERDALTSEIELLKTPQMDIEYVGVPPHKDSVLNIDTFRVAVKNKSKTSDLKLVNLWLVNVSSVSGWNHNRSDMRLRQNGDNPSEDSSFRQDASLTPGQSLDYEFISRWREHGSAITLHYAIHTVDSIPCNKQYRITLKATASNCVEVFRQFLINVDSRERLIVEPFPSYVKN